MQNIDQAIALLNLHVSAATHLQEQADEAKFNTHLPLFDGIASKAEERQGVFLQRVLDLLDEGGSFENMPKIIGSKDSYLDPYPKDLPDAEAHMQAVRWALATFAMKTREAIVVTNNHTADVFTEVSRAADQVLRNM